MSAIKSLSLRGFRGIMAPVSLEFTKGNSLRSMVVYGRNGTGKTSITDAWEWLYRDKVRHLAKEGAQERSYPHVNAGDGDTSVRCSFSSNIGWDDVELTFQPDRVTIPERDGPVDQFREAIPHPCHVRFGDLARFVYQQKAERYDHLAGLMGFSPQVDFQKALVRVEKQLESKIETKQEKISGLRDDLGALLGVTDWEVPSMLSSLSVVFERHGLGEAESVGEAAAKRDLLREKVTNDPRARELAILNHTLAMLKRPDLSEDLERRLSEYVSESEQFLGELESTLELILLDLFETGKDVLVRVRAVSAEGMDRCPLCGQSYEGDLLAHINEELERRRALAERRASLERDREQLQVSISSMLDGFSGIDDLRDLPDELHEEFASESSEVARKAEAVRSTSSEILEALEVKPEDLSASDLEEIRSRLRDWPDVAGEFTEARASAVEHLEAREEELREDESRVELVEDHELVTRALDLFTELDQHSKYLHGLLNVTDRYSDIVADYLDQSTAGVQARFEEISDNVKNYFEILEADSSQLGDPKLSVSPGEDRAVLLKIQFMGESVDHAYAYLSQSQLNSFGLAVFLASVRQFNSAFKFLLLDDVINSFDAYKRPRVIDLLKSEFGDFQILLLTHDTIFFDRVMRECPTWIKKRITRYQSGTGPIFQEAVATAEEVQDWVDQDRPDLAGKVFGQFLERELQALCESFEVLVKYNQRNEYSLDPLLTRLRVRVGRKLGSDHTLHQRLESLIRDSGFRNFEAHFKNPEAPITAGEMQSALGCWLEVEELVRCSEEGCLSYLQYNRDDSCFECRCGSTTLE